MLILIYLLRIKACVRTWQFSKTLFTLYLCAQCTPYNCNKPYQCALYVHFALKAHFTLPTKIISYALLIARCSEFKVGAVDEVFVMSSVSFDLVQRGCFKVLTRIFVYFYLLELGRSFRIRHIDGTDRCTAGVVSLGELLYQTNIKPNDISFLPDSLLVATFLTTFINRVMPPHFGPGRSHQFRLSLKYWVCKVCILWCIVVFFPKLSNLRHNNKKELLGEFLLN